MAENKPVVRLSHIKKSFVDAEVLKDISLEVNPGEVVAIIGPSGGGKSTLLRCATLLETFDAGELSYGDLEVATMQNGKAVYGKKDVLRAAKSRFGLVFQNYNLFPHYTVLKNIMDAPIAVQKRDKADVERQARELIAKMGLEGNEGKVPCELSGGQQQRVSIARALCLNPDIVFFDEPTSALDPGSTMKVEELMSELKKNYTVVIVTHNMQQAARISDRTAFFLLGELVECGPTSEIFSTPKDKRTEDYISGRFG